MSYWKVVAVVIIGLGIGLIWESSDIREDFSLSSVRRAASYSENTRDNDSRYSFIGSSQPYSFKPLQLVLIEGSSLKGYSFPTTISSKVLGSMAQEDAELDKHGEINSYIVREGDTPSSIAGQFNISLNTLLWANDLSSKSSIKIGQKLIILPVSGVMYLVKEEDTLGGIAQKCKGAMEEIMLINDISDDGKIFIGDILIVPGGEKPASASPTSNYSIPVANHYFTCPIPAPCNITQGLHSFNAIDFSNGNCGDPIYAAAGGTVQRTGYHNIAGRYVRILHPNGVVTFYGHLSKYLVSVGEKVSQGTIIGYMGHTGYTIPSGSRGCHLHFEVRGAVNPFAK